MTALNWDRMFYKKFFIIVFSLAIQNIIVFGVNLADNVMIGALDEVSLSGVALANQMQFFLQMLTVGIGEAVIVLSAQYWGKRDVESIKKIISVGLRIGVIASLILWGIVFFAPHFCAGLFVKDEMVIAEAVKYLRIICFSYLFFCLTNILLASLRSVETVKIGLVVSFSTLTVNIFLNYVLIYGNFGAPALGVRGAAIATLSARIIELAVVLVYLKRFDKKLIIAFRQLLLFDEGLFRDYIRVGLPVILSTSLWGVAIGVQTSILGHLGASSIAAKSIATTVFQILTVVTYASASASAVMIGKTIGEGKVGIVKEYTKSLQVVYIVIGIVTGAALFFSKDLIISFYAISLETKVLARQFINVLSVTVIGTSYQVACISGILRGGGSTKFMLYNDMIFIWLVVTPFSLLAAFVWRFSPTVVFGFLKSDQILKCFMAAFMVNRYRWIKQLTRSEEIGASFALAAKR